jgi:hypothetical protein
MSPPFREHNPFVLDTTQPSPNRPQTPSIAYSRSFLNLTELPDGSALATGGEKDKTEGTLPMLFMRRSSGHPRHRLKPRCLP